MIMTIADGYRQAWYNRMSLNTYLILTYEQTLFAITYISPRSMWKKDEINSTICLSCNILKYIWILLSICGNHQTHISDIEYWHMNEGINHCKTFPSTPHSFFQSESSHEIFVLVISSNFKMNKKTDKDFVLRLAMKQRLKWNRKWLIRNSDWALVKDPLHSAQFLCWK